MGLSHSRKAPRPDPAPAPPPAFFQFNQLDTHQCGGHFLPRLLSIMTALFPNDPRFRCITYRFPPHANLIAATFDSHGQRHQARAEANLFTREIPPVCALPFEIGV
jgi:hypothetical protein